MSIDVSIYNIYLTHMYLCLYLYVHLSDVPGLPPRVAASSCAGPMEASKVGLFGFSKGGFTTLNALGPSAWRGSLGGSLKGSLRSS